MNLDDLRAFEAVVRLQYPELQIAFKERSKTQKFLGYLMFAFNPWYMSKYTSTFAPTVYFPTQDSYERNPRGSISLLAHELVHLLDTKKHPFWFRWTYLFPQIMAPIGFLVYGLLARSHAWPLAVLFAGAVLALVIARVSTAAFFVLMAVVLAGSGVLAVLVSGWASVALFAGLACLAPWPSPGRVYWERRGYAMSLGVYQWTTGSVPQILRDSYSRAFVASFYFYMSWQKEATKKWVDATVERAANGELAKEQPYGVVHDFFHSRGMDQQ